MIRWRPARPPAATGVPAAGSGPNYRAPRSALECNGPEIARPDACSNPPHTLKNGQASALNTSGSNRPSSYTESPTTFQ